MRIMKIVKCIRVSLGDFKRRRKKYKAKMWGEEGEEWRKYRWRKWGREGKRKQRPGGKKGK